MVNKMNPEVKAEWIEALRSGEYKKGMGRLRGADSPNDYYCCLGVLCELAVKAGVIEPVERGGIYDSYRYGEEGELSLLPKAVQEWAGVTDVGDLPEPVTHDKSSEDVRYLTTFNDILSVTFNDVAEVIEEAL